MEAAEHLSRRESLELAAGKLDLGSLQHRVTSGWSEIEILKQFETCFDLPRQTRRDRALEEIAVCVMVREKKLRKQRKEAKKNRGKSNVEFATEPRGYGLYDRDCVYATCVEGEEEAGPIWGHGENSVKRALATLAESCDCGATFHWHDDGKQA